MMLPFVSLGLAVCEKLEIQDSQAQKLVMRFCKLYSPEKIALIVEQTKTYPWWRSNTKAAFMKSVGDINRKEKDGQISATK